MATTFLGWRPSPLAAACAPSSLAAAAQPYALGHSAVSVAFAGANAGNGFKVRTAPIFGHPAVADAMKINNSISTIAATAVEGATTSNLPMSSAALAQMLRVQKVQDDKVMGGNARGNPPRGRPV